MLDCQQASAAGSGGKGGAAWGGEHDASANYQEKKSHAAKSSQAGLVEKFVSFMGKLEVARVRKEAQVKTGPEPWLVRKFAIGMVIGIFGYAYYVFVVRLCIRMVRLDPNRLGSRSQGIAYLVIFHFFFLMFIWSYGMVVSIAPGLARDYVPKTDPPQEKVELVQVDPRARYSARYDEHPQSIRPGFHEGFSEENSTRDFTQNGQKMAHRDSGLDSPGLGSAEALRETDSLAVADGDKEANRPVKVPESGSQHNSEEALEQTLEPTKVSGTLQQDGSSPLAAQSASAHVPISKASPAPPSAKDEPPLPAQPHYPFDQNIDGSSRDTNCNAQQPGQPNNDVNLSTATLESYIHFNPPSEHYKPAPPQPIPIAPEKKKAKFNFERMPPHIPVLTDDYRYDTREGFLRPYRSHRCKHCGTVVLKMDHHCPWVGQCVGARNYKYFYNFLQWATPFCLFVAVSVTVANFKTYPQANRPSVDPQQMVILGFAYFFTLFTGSLLAAHTRLIMLNLTTIEDIGLSNMKSRERSVLQNAFGFCGIKEAREKRKEWSLEWGRLGREANVWWLGSRRANWIMVHGENKLGWFRECCFPPVFTDGDSLHT